MSYLKEKILFILMQTTIFISCFIGNYEDIMKSCEDISSFVTEEKEPPEDDIKGKLKSSEISDDFSKENDEKSALIPENNAPKPNEETSKLGSVSKQVYLGYIKGKKIRIFFLYFSSLKFIFFQISF